MGNGQNRNRRGGARARRGPHRGGAGGDKRGATHVMPPTQASPVDLADSAQDVELAEAADITDDTTSVEPQETINEAIAAEVAEIAEEDFERAAGELRGASGSATSGPEPGVEVASAPGIPADVPTLAANSTPSSSNLPDIPDVPEEHDVAPSARVPEAGVTGAEAATPDVDASHEQERRAPRGRFERFYAPGQGPRADHNGHTITPPAASGATSSTRRPLRDSIAAYEPLAPDDDEDDGMAVSGPREDVRGPVGALIDSLHEMFTRDRSVASQGGASRCGVCYFHFPLSDLIYREAEGFYVCQGCEQALGSGRIPMVRRQQRL